MDIESNMPLVSATPLDWRQMGEIFHAKKESGGKRKGISGGKSYQHRRDSGDGSTGRDKLKA